MYRKGHGTKCVYTCSIAKALYDVAEATVIEERIEQWSDRGSCSAGMR